MPPTIVRTVPEWAWFTLSIRGAVGTWVVWDYAQNLEEALALVETALKNGESVIVECVTRKRPA
jgi:hypothetical protein